MSKNYRNQPGTEKSLRKLRILVAPLDWGLGHATRCIPVIYELLRQGAEVWLAGEGPQEHLLRQEFPQIPCLPLKGYRIKYARSAAGLIRQLAIQAPRILQTIRQENKWLQRMVKQHGFDGVISDNRYGLYHASIPSIFITHQLLVKTPFGRWSELVLQKKNYRYINRFTACWVPDTTDEFAGELARPAIMPSVPVYYAGLLSRLARTGAVHKRSHLFISLSGPEPQRSLLENTIIEQVSHYNGTATVVRGLPASASFIPSSNDIRFFNHLPTEEYNSEMEKAEWVISRSGYSTVMDILQLGKKSILIPTPGQTEQEYLAKYLEERRFACQAEQKGFELDIALAKAAGFAYHLPSPETSRLQNIVADFLSSC